MVTKRKTELDKASGDMRRAFVRFTRALPMVAWIIRAMPKTRPSWRTILMPWRLIPSPVALALIALVALAMVLDSGEEVTATDGISHQAVGIIDDCADTGGILDMTDGVCYAITIGADTVAPGTACAEDEVISYLVLLGGEGVGCVHYEYIVMEFIADCLIGNSDHGDNLASYHLRDPAFGSWCNDVIDDASDGTVSLADLIVDTAYTSEVSSTAAITPTVSPAVTTTPTAAMRVPVSLPNAGGH